jgi:hypothetical protein
MSITHAIRRRALSVAAALLIALVAVTGTALPVQAQQATAPSAPEITLLTESPQAGQELRFEVASSDDGVITAFHYGVNVGAPQHTVESDGTAVIAFTAQTGRTVLDVWAEDDEGNTSPRASYTFTAGRFLAPVAKGAWRLDGNGVDDANQLGTLDVPGAAWESTAAPAPFGRALGFDGAQCYRTGGGTALRTDAAFWVTAWVRLDSNAADQVFVSKAGANRSGFALGYDAESDRFTVTVAESDTAEGSAERSLASTAAPVLGAWTHLSVLVSPQSAMRLYVDGAQVAETSLPFITADFTGPIGLGCDALQGTSLLDGAVTHVSAWAGLPNQAYRDAAYRGDLVPGPAAAWQLRGTGGDTSPLGRNLTLPGSTTWEADQWGRAASAAGFDGGSCATVDDRLLTSQGDLSVEAWVRLDATDRDQTILAQATSRSTAFSLGYDAAAGAWRLALPSDNGSHPEWAVASAAAGVEAGTWTHLVATVSTDRDAATRLALYVDGALAATTEADFTPVLGNDLVTVGCAKSLQGEAGRYLDGALSGVRLWHGTLGVEAAAASYGGNPAATIQAGWIFTFGDIENWTDQELAIVGTEGADWYWEDVFEGMLWTGLRLDGTGNGYGTSQGPVLTTDESFTVVTAINLADKATDQTFVAQAGADGPAFDLGYDAARDRIRFTMPSADGTTAEVLAPAAPATDQWIHVAAVYDLKAGRMHLYLDGVAVASADGPSSPWQADGPVTLGIAADTAGGHWNALHGAISNTFLYESVASDREIEGHAGIV